ncbi:Regulatory protein LuxO [compost metagenome]
MRALAAHSSHSRILSLETGDLGLGQAADDAPSAPAEAQMGDLPSGELRPALEAFQRQLIARSLERHQGNWAAVARELGVDRANLSRLARRLELK